MKKDNKIKIFIILLITIMLMGITSITVYSNVCAPKFYDYFIDTGIKYLTNGKYEEAILAFNKAIKIDEKTTEARVYLAEGYIGNKEYDKAIDVLEEAQDLDITNEELLKEILDILNEINADIAYEFLDRFIQEVGEKNISQDISDILDTAYENPEAPIVDPQPGTYLSSIIVKIKQDKIRVGHSYYYTVDGSEPNKNSHKYNGQIKIDKSTTIKIIGYNKNNESTEVKVFNYIIDKDIVNKTKDSIEEAKNLTTNTNVGDEVGQISKDNIDKLKLNIKEATSLINKESVTYEEISSIKSKIENAIIEFKENIIKPVDKSKLETAISQASNLHNNATEGSQKGQYKSGSKSILMDVINKAKKVYNNKLAKQDEIDAMVSTLNSSINNFKNKKITQSDRNSDGSYTRAYVEQYLKKKYPTYNVIVDDSWGDEMYNGEVCYLVFLTDKEGFGDNGWTRTENIHIGSKTLNEYSYIW